MAFVFVAEVRSHLGWPLISFGERKAIGVIVVHGGAETPNDAMCLGQALAGCTVAFYEVWNSVKTKAIDAEVKPEAHGFENLVHDCRVYASSGRADARRSGASSKLWRSHPQVQSDFSVSEKIIGTALVELIGGRPDVKVAFGRAFWRMACSLKPGMPIGRVVDH